MDRAHLSAWLTGYERAWRTPGTDGLRELFTDDATYRPGPYDDPAVGLEAIAALWERERASADEPFTMVTEPVAMEGGTAVVRVHVAYAGPPAREYRDVWIVGFAPDGRCGAFEEWPFFPGQPLTAHPDEE